MQHSHASLQLVDSFSSIEQSNAGKTDPIMIVALFNDTKMCVLWPGLTQEYLN